jgi:hypothetical protein
LPEGERYVLDLRAATEEDFLVDLAHRERDKKPSRRESRPKPPFAKRMTDAPVVPCREEE